MDEWEIKSQSFKAHNTTHYNKHLDMFRLQSFFQSEKGILVKRILPGVRMGVVSTV